MKATYKYSKVPDGYSFSTVFPTYILAFCPDTNEWFVSNNRFFYYEYPKEFNTNDEACDYFYSHLEEFFEIRDDIADYINKSDDMYFIEMSDSSGKTKTTRIRRT